MPKASSTPQGPSENARRIEDAYKCALSRGGAASVALCIVLVCIMPCHAWHGWFRHTLHSRVGGDETTEDQLDADNVADEDTLKTLDPDSPPA